MKRRSKSLLVLAVLAAWLAVYFLVAHPGLIQWGSTPAEQTRVLPGDELTPNAVRLNTRAITIQAPPDKIWPWLMQLGIGRSGFYSYTWLENLLLSGIHNDFRSLPEKRIAQPGTFVRSFQFGAEAPGKNGWIMEPFKAGEYFYLNPGWGPFLLEPAGEGATRFLIRSQRGPGSATANVLLDLLFDPIHGTMEKRTMVSVKALAEGRRPLSGFLTAVATLGFLAAALLSSGAITVRRGKKWWILLPSFYSALVLALTMDLKAALVAQVALGTIVAFFCVHGRRAWAYMAFFWIYAFAVLIWAKDAYVVFGLTLILPELALLANGSGTRAVDKEAP
jgi:hypothetical protein